MQTKSWQDWVCASNDQKGGRQLVPICTPPCKWRPPLKSARCRHSRSRAGSAKSTATASCWRAKACKLAANRQKLRHNCHGDAGNSSSVSPAILKVKVGGKELSFETGQIGRQANGAVLVRDGETVLYTTACCSKDPGEHAFLPLSVHYAERFSAAGQTSGAFHRREGKPKASDLLTARLTDRSLRPMLPSDWSCDTQILTWLLSYDGQSQVEQLSITAASVALAISDIPLKKAVAGVRVGLVDGQYIVNPTQEQQRHSRLDLTMAGTSSAVLMIEGFCDFLTDDEMLKALEVGSEAIRSLCDHIQSWADQIGKPKRSPSHPYDTSTQKQTLTESAHTAQPSADSIGVEERDSELANLQSPSAEQAEGEGVVETIPKASQSISAALKEAEARADGRGLEEVRPISASCGLLPRTHGSALFTRGQTQAIAVTTLGPVQHAAIQDSIMTGENRYKRFYLQYVFPPSSVGETGRVAGPGRREVGHGILAERALMPAIPDQRDFPYTIRVESTITESNGSSSMASVCGGCLAMLDAGVPLKREIAGVAMGLILNDDGTYKVLTDISGSEDALGDMDFKVAGDADTITAFQMDIKVEGVSLEIIRTALRQAREARCKILEEMSKCAPPPRRDLGPYTDHITRVSVSQSMMGLIIGTGGRTIRSLREIEGVKSIQSMPEEEGTFEIVATSQKAAELCKSKILALASEPEIGKLYTNCKVIGAEKFGLIVEFMPGKQGLLHCKEMAENEALTDFDLDDRLDVRLIAIEGSRHRLSRLERPRFLEAGTVVRNAKVTDVQSYGIFISIPGTSRQALVHMSELQPDVLPRRGLRTWSVGDTIDVVALEPALINGTLRQNFSRMKLAMQEVHEMLSKQDHENATSASPLTTN